MADTNDRDTKEEQKDSVGRDTDSVKGTSEKQNGTMDGRIRTAFARARGNDDLTKQVTQLKKCLNESRYTVAITGAGISFSAGGMNFDHENVNELLPLASEDVLRNG